MRIAIAQINPTVGDIDGNAAMIARAVEASAELGAELVVTPELALCGYPPRDLLLREDFVRLCDERVDRLAREIPSSIGLIVGHPTHFDQPTRAAGGTRRSNAASLLDAGERVATIHKSLLPNYDVFDEHRYFRAAVEAVPIPFRGQLLGVHICEDGWWRDPSAPHATDSIVRRDPVEVLIEAGASILINLSSSPFELDKPELRELLMASHAERHGRPFVYVNQHGGNDDLVFDGGSFVANSRGHIVDRCARWADDLRVVDTADLPVDAVNACHGSREAEAVEALACGVGDYTRKTGFTDVVLGISGGIDSALVAAICARALGPTHVHGIAMPSRYSSDHSIDDARALAEAIGFELMHVPIEPAHRAFEELAGLGSELTADPTSVTAQNVQSRIRGSVVMAVSNARGWLPVTTGNKSEFSVGYSTLYGDQNGGFAVIADLYKTDVYRVCEFINEDAGRPVIPVSTLEKPPSAELAPGQRDDTDLPPYDVLDPILMQLVDEQRGVGAVDGDPELVRDIARRVRIAEFKRYQLAPATKLMPRAFGPGWRQPLARK